MGVFMGFWWCSGGILVVFERDYDGVHEGFCSVHDILVV